MRRRNLPWTRNRMPCCRIEKQNSEECSTLCSTGSTATAPTRKRAGRCSWCAGSRARQYGTCRACSNLHCQTRWKCGYFESVLKPSSWHTSQGGPHLASSPSTAVPTATVAVAGERRTSPIHPVQRDLSLIRTLHLQKHLDKE